MRPTRSGTFWGVCLIGILFGIAIYLPNLSKTRRYTLEDKIDESSTLAIPMDVPLRRVSLESGTLEAQNLITLKEVTQPNSHALINLWATWCPPCIEELPSLSKLAEQLSLNAQLKLPIVALSVDESAKEVEHLFQTLGFLPKFPILLDPGGTLSTKIGTTKFPETYLIDPNGKILKKWIGPQDWLGAEILRDLTEWVNHS